MKKYFISITLIILSTCFCLSCRLFSPELDLSFNMSGALALGSTVNTSSRAARDAEGNDAPLELKKITKNGSDYVLNFVNANTNDFLVRHVVQDPYGASKDVYVILDHPTLITDNSLFPTQKIYLGQIIAIHEDGSYTSFPEWHGSDDYGWLSSTSYEKVDSTVSFDKDGNMYYMYDKQIFKSGEYIGSYLNLYKYNPTTRKNTVVSNAPSGVYSDYLISNTHNWAILETYQQNENDLNIYSLNETSEIIHINSFIKYYQPSDFRYTFHNTDDILYYEDINPSTEETALYKLESKNGTFNLEDKELLLDGNFDFYAKIKLIYTANGLWGCSSTHGLCHILDENDNILTTTYPETTPSHTSVEFKVAGNNIFIITESSIICFDTITNTCTDVLASLPDAQNLLLNSHSINESCFTYSARNKITGETLNGFINVQTMENNILNAKENFASIVLLNEMTEE